MNPKKLKEIQERRRAEFYKPCTECGKEGPDAVVWISGERRWCVQCFLRSEKEKQKRLRDMDGPRVGMMAVDYREIIGSVADDEFIKAQTELNKSFSLAIPKELMDQKPSNYNSTEKPARGNEL